MKTQVNEIKRMQQLAGILKENQYTPRYSEEYASKLFDYHEKTGMLPDGITEEEFDELMAHYGIKRDNDNDIDPAGGYGIHSHI